MILEKPIQQGSVITVKLISSEELLARYESETDQYITVSKPAVLTVQGQSMGMVPWMVSAPNRNVKINKAAVVTFVAADEDIAKSFTEATSSIKMV